ncbi:MAG: NUDIX hydrolase [Pseudonocardia sp.]|nr:NUDIX hydrolase [Pseudonocardia sp.]
MLITDPDDARVLIVNPTYKPRWELPGGAVEADESPAAAAAREIREELGLALPVGRLLALDYVPTLHLPDTATRTESLVTVFDGGHLHTLDTVTLPPDELSDAAFIGLDQLPDYLPALQSRRAIASVHARRAGTVAYLEDGRQ